MIRTTKTEKVTNSIVDYVRAQFVEGKLPAGSKLPSERKLALDFGISRASVREAISILKTMGILEVRHRAGIFVAEPKMSQNVANYADIQFNTLNYQNRAVELLEFLSLITNASVQLMINRSTEDDLITLTITIERINSCISNRIKPTWFELEFLLLLTELSGNTFFYQTVSSLKAILVEIIRAVEHVIISDDTIRLQYMFILKDLFSAIKNKDINLIKSALESYFNLMQQCIVKSKKQKNGYL